MEREKGAIEVLISIEESPKPMHAEAVTAGFFKSKTWGKKYPKLQLLTIAELLAGKKINMPPIRRVGATFKKAEKFTEKGGEQLKIDDTSGCMIDHDHRPEYCVAEKITIEEGEDVNN